MRVLTSLLSLIIFVGLFSFTNPALAQTKKELRKEKIKKIDTKLKSGEEEIDQFFRTYLVSPLDAVLFWDPFKAFGLYDPVIKDEMGQPILSEDGKPKEKKIPLVVIWLVLGAVFFTIRMKFINFKGMKHALHLVQGKYSNPDDKGEVSHFQALATALSATVGLGNIAGVAVAVSLGGAGATFWMICAGLLGMASKFTECTLGVKYRVIDENGHVSGGPMYYLSRALDPDKYGPLGKILAAIFAVLCIGGSFGGGNMFQANQAYAQLSSEFTFMQGHGILFGVVLAIMVGIVIIGGIRSIAKVTDKIVPFMTGMYVLFSLVIILINIGNIGEALNAIFMGAFSPGALKGGFIGVLIVGFQRAAFSNEAGVGSASIAHSASKTNEPVSEGTVALLEPFIDTVVVCTMTALVLIFTGYASNTEGLEGANLTSAAFQSVFPWFKYVLIIAILLFAFSTMISWSYYGQKAFTYLFGRTNTSRMIYKIIFLCFIVVGSSSSLGAVLDFSDMMILGMAFPNILGLFLLSKEVRGDMLNYFQRVKSGQIKRFK
jgi:AGCS family alanine or glycine:cation symporter